MQNITGDLFAYHKDPESAICIPTNAILKNNGELVMGAGVALTAKLKFPELPYLLGNLIQARGHRVHYIEELRIFSFPTKYHWKEDGDLELVKKSAMQLENMVDDLGIEKIYLPKVGCGLGKIDWNLVERELSSILSDDRYSIVSFGHWKKIFS
jgi:hypothetical protein